VRPEFTNGSRGWHGEKRGTLSGSLRKKKVARGIGKISRDVENGEALRKRVRTDYLATVALPWTLETLRSEAIVFAKAESKFPEPSLFGVTDGKAVGTYLEHKFQAYLQSKYEFAKGSSAKGIDFPELDVDIKVTSIRQPQSSCPFKSARQKIYGLGYSL